MTMTKVQNSPITTKYCIDSFKLSIDLDKLKSTNVPTNRFEGDEDSGEILRTFKKNSLAIDYNGATIYISVFQKMLRQKSIDKLFILFSSKVCGADYFSGIQKHHVIDVLHFLKSQGRIDFDDVNLVYRNLFTKDTDVKIDFVFKKTEKEKIVKYNKELENLFQHDIRDLKIFNSEKQGLGIQTFERDGKNTITKPFTKFYDKSKELTTKSKEFFATLPSDLRQFVQENFIYRFEFTLKDKTFFEKFGISNRLEDTLEVLNSKWAEISKVLLNANFQVKVRKPKNISSLNYYEQVLALFVLQEMNAGKTLAQIKTKFTAIQKDRKAKYKASEMFDRLYFALVPEKVKELRDSLDYVQKYHALFGLG